MPQFVAESIAVPIIFAASALLVVVTHKENFITLMQAESKFTLKKRSFISTSILLSEVSNNSIIL